MDRAILATHLERLGLSDREADTYLAALDHDRVDAGTIAIALDVPRDTVETAGRRLADRGFVTLDAADQLTVAARPPEAVLASLRDSIRSLEEAIAGEERTDGTDETDGVDGTDRDASARPFEALVDRPALLEAVTDLLESATEEVALSIPASFVEEVEPELRDAVERGVLVALLVFGDDGGDERTADRLEGLASVARVWSRDAPVIVTADYGRGVMAPSALFTAGPAAGTGDGGNVANRDTARVGETAHRADSGDDHSAGYGPVGISLEQRHLAFVLIGSFFGNYWRIATQLYAADPAPLPRTETNIRHAVFQATRHLDAGTDVAITAEARPVGTDEFTTVEGRLVDVRQSLLEPVHESFAIENGLIVDRDGGAGERITLGGEHAFVEEFKTRSVTLSPLE